LCENFKKISLADSKIFPVCPEKTLI